MRVFIDLISEDEMFTDASPYKVKGCFYVVQGKMTTEQASSIDDSLIGGNASAEGGEPEQCDAGGSGPPVCDVVSSMRLAETSFNKKQLMTYLKSYLKRIKEDMVNNGKPEDEIKAFMTEAQEGFKTLILPNISDFQFFMGEKMDADGALGFLNFDEDDKPYLLFFRHGLRDEKV